HCSSARSTSSISSFAILISLMEEGAWMAFVTARLQRRWGPFWASLAVAPLFGFVHFPLFFLANGLTDGAPPRGVQVLEYAFYLLILFSVPMRIVITWVFNSSGGSVGSWPCSTHLSTRPRPRRC